MNTTTLSLIVIGVLILTISLRFVLQPQIRRTDPRKRYRLFAVLLWFGVGSQAIGVAASAFSKKGGGMEFLLVGSLIGIGCLLEMRKLRREF